MDTAKTIKELRESTGMSRKEFSEHTGIPVRTLEDWEAGRRTPPDYLPRLIAYQLKFEEKVARKEDRNVSVIQDAEGNKIVVINDIVFKGKRCVQWEDVEEYLKRYVGEFYSIVEDSEIIYIGSELPNEYARSVYTKNLKGTVAKAKANAAQAIPEMIEIASNGAFEENRKPKHGRDAKNGWYRYDTRFALPVYGEDGNVERYNIFRGRILIRHASGGKKYLYDVLEIKKETGKSCQT
ncbi:MAG: helix-turn-helix domain-containing protein [Lachnospiraceae bacterium]|nr:helix-turn-helix domain-containing protein [Lachnospiraceae bacterium]